MSGSKKKQFSIKYISEYIDASIDGDVDLEINKISTIEDAENGSITFLANSKYNKLIDTTKASAVVVKSKIKTNKKITFLVCEDPYLAYAKISKLFSNEEDFHRGKIKNNTFIHDSAVLKDGSVIGPNVFIGENCIIGENTVIYPNTTLLRDVSIGDNCKIHPNAILGSDGFGFA